MCSWGDPKKLRDDVLPTQIEVYNLYLFVKNDKVANGEWDRAKFTPMSTRVNCVLGHLCTLWDKTGIPHCLSSKDGERKLTNLITKCQKVSKVPLARRDKDNMEQFLNLFDAALCTHDSAQACTCPQGNKVILSWSVFL